MKEIYREKEEERIHKRRERERKRQRIENREEDVMNKTSSHLELLVF